MNYAEFQKLVAYLQGYLIVPKFLFKDKGMLFLMRDMLRQSIQIFHTYKMFNSNRSWQKSWNDPDFREQFSWALCYTESDFVIGSGCFAEIDYFLKVNIPVYHVTYNGYYRFSRVTQLSQPFPENDWARYAKVITDDSEAIGFETKQATCKVGSNIGQKKARLQSQDHS